jgi:hypothetical protein
MVHLLQDAAREQYADWRCDAEAVSMAYAAWRSAQPDDRAGARAGYYAALDQEAQAADVYAEIVHSLETLRAESRGRTPIAAV